MLGAGWADFSVPMVKDPKGSWLASQEKKRAFQQWEVCLLGTPCHSLFFVTADLFLFFLSFLTFEMDGSMSPRPPRAMTPPLCAL